MTYPHDDNQNDNRRPGPEGDDEGPIMPAGDYAVIAIAAKLGYAGTKNEQIGARLRITEGPLKNKTMLWYGSFSGAAEEFTVKAMRALGFAGNDLRDLSSMLGGQAAIAVVQHDTYQGKLRAKVAWINGADVQMKDEMNTDELAAFAQRMRGVFARHSGGASQPAKAVGHPQGRQQPTSGDPRDRRDHPANERAASDRGRDEQQRFGANNRDTRSRNDAPTGDEPWNQGR